MDVPGFLVKFLNVECESEGFRWGIGAVGGGALDPQNHKWGRPPFLGKIWGKHGSLQIRRSNPPQIQSPIKNPIGKEEHIADGFGGTLPSGFLFQTRAHVPKHDFENLSPFFFMVCTFFAPPPSVMSLISAILWVCLERRFLRCRDRVHL